MKDQFYRECLALLSNWFFEGLFFEDSPKNDFKINQNLIYLQNAVSLHF